MRGIYFAGNGMLNSLADLNTISNNLANVDTTGYKKDINSFRAVYEREISSYNQKKQKLETLGNLYAGTVLDDISPTFSQGEIVDTGNKYDFAIEGKGFFKVERDGEFFYTRNGEFKRNSEGYLVNNSGDYILNVDNERIEVNEDFFVNGNGNINNTNEYINVVDLENHTKHGYTLFQGDEIEAQDFTLRQYSIEKSNVNALNEMVNLINANRKFDILQKAVTSNDGLNAKISEIAQNI
ncbi:flagellar hook-basal body protein [Geotoga petraea]|jgi:flagellar basal-body rod protein FlgG|uniref:Flagellar basal-body rod protein FlgG n=1 Tax=Geotoga petraea TaxID=28234 RepID=A0A1G6I7M4_9BACT|nr:flagellar hook-basal body protein [Geotoga petraea]MDK2945491.1 flagellar basal-body rod protein FlgF [Geotoga sp.]TGG89113.1 flagellar hook-basal body protein [Geotoga petraea]SDC02373.1 flagellar basal-body rod protein FlgG [Geotoga petraea]